MVLESVDQPRVTDLPEKDRTPERYIALSARFLLNEGQQQDCLEYLQRIKECYEFTPGPENTFLFGRSVQPGAKSDPSGMIHLALVSTEFIDLGFSESTKALQAIAENDRRLPVRAVGFPPSKWETAKTLPLLRQPVLNHVALLKCRFEEVDDDMIGPPLPETRQF